MTNHPLTLSELAEILDAIDRTDSPADALLTTLTKTSRALTGDERGSLLDYAIPHGQAVIIGAKLLERCRQLGASAIDSVTITMEWSNRGPSTYQETA